MHGPVLPPMAADAADGPQATAYVWGIAVVAALGGLLFGYDWVVIGGARQFFEVHFHLTSAGLIGWANSCALVGCFAGSLLAGSLGDRFGRKPILLLSAVLFAVSSVCTGWAASFFAFILWRIVGGVAIGLSSNIAPLYIAEVSPAAHRGRLVSLNQFAVVVGILLAQITNWQIAREVPAHLSPEILLNSWNVQRGWRWMFTAVAVPSVIFLAACLRIPESPRWLIGRGRTSEALQVLRRIGGSVYADLESKSIHGALRLEESESASRAGSWRSLLQPGMRKVLLVGIALAVLQQWSGINVLFNYAEEIFSAAGLGTSHIFLDIAVTGTINLVSTVIAMLIVDRIGRRPLMLFGCCGIALSHLLVGMAYGAGLHGIPILLLVLCAIACYAMTLAPLTWVLIAEIFPNRIRSFGVSSAVAALWVASFVLTYSFPFLQRSVGSSGTFFTYGGICLAGAVFVFFYVGETRGQTLEQIEAGALHR